MQKTALCALACVAAGYFIGCINPAVIIGRIKAGASNTVIMAGKLAGVLVALLDIFKAALSWRLCQALFPQFALAGILGGVACILGHMFPVFLHFCGGKGLACIGGVVLAYDPATFLIMLAITCVIGFATNYIAIATVSIAAIWPVYYGVTTGFWAGAAVLAVPFVPILLRHMTNFRRIRAGEELRLNFLWKKDSELERIGYED